MFRIVIVMIIRIVVVMIKLSLKRVVECGEIFLIKLIDLEFDMVFFEL